MTRAHLKPLNFGPHLSGLHGLSFEEYVKNALNQIERWSYEVERVISEGDAPAATTVDELLLEDDFFLLRQGGAGNTMGLE